MKTVLKISASVVIAVFLLGGNFGNSAKVPEISKDINEFSIEFLKQNAKASGAPANAIMSPQSIYYCMAMSYIASGGDTRKELAKILRFPDNNKLLEQDIQGLRRSLLKNKNKNINVKIANSLWLDKNRASFSEDYIKEIKEAFWASVSDLDFSKKEEASGIVNSWVAKKTNDRINNIVSPQDFDSEYSSDSEKIAVLLLLNVVYFKADWGQRFNKSNTKEKTFHIDKDNKTKTMMMYQNSEFYCSENDKLKFLKLPYIGNTYSMYVILPKEITPIEKLMDEISTDMIKEMESRAYSKKVDILLPKFEMKNRIDVGNSLEAMGIKTAFDVKAADFDKMINKTQDGLKIYIRKIVQEAWIEVNEKGTEAAAVTACEGGCEGIDEPATFHADHPFLFLIVHNQSKSILFGGWISNPDKLKE